VCDEPFPPRTHPFATLADCVLPTRSVLTEICRCHACSCQEVSSCHALVLPMRAAQALRECKKQKRMVSETTRQLKKLLADLEGLFNSTCTFGVDMVRAHAATNGVESQGNLSQLLL
jgi:hypothetical protein